MSESLWVSAQAVRIIHNHQNARDVGGFGFRIEVLLQYALQWIVNKWHYKNAVMVECAAGYVFLLRYMNSLKETRG